MWWGVHWAVWGKEGKHVLTVQPEGTDGTWECLRGRVTL
jgi:hypothetical protein